MTLATRATRVPRTVIGERFSVNRSRFTVHRPPFTASGTPPAHTCVPTSGGCGVWNGTRMDSRAAAPVGLGAPQDRLVVVTAIAAISPARPATALARAEARALAPAARASADRRARMRAAAVWPIAHATSLETRRTSCPTLVRACGR